MPETAIVSPDRRLRRAARAIACSAVLIGLQGGAQTGLPQRPTLGGATAQGNDSEFEPGNSLEEERRLQALNADRQKALVSDTSKLLRLTVELNGEIDRTNPDKLTPGQERKVAEIEKLARSIKEKMSLSVRGVPPFRLPPFAMPR